ncbi:hypothetical protein [Streptomyces sp. G1]|uniref:hypothetical protein n=1 Tax=Streptomyces sp. G1 TaxID=361572 RepID=UPI00202F22AB|nr:hypothetical protein [Streptomyces sp. G1]MCM1977166.1 hypothetical protein [Streptomyces sp. G1]
MVQLTVYQLLAVAFIGGCTAGLTSTLLRLTWRGLYRLFDDLITWHEARRERRRQLAEARRQLSTFTIDDLKE